MTRLDFMEKLSSPVFALAQISDIDKNLQVWIDCLHPTNQGQDLVAICARVAGKSLTIGFPDPLEELWPFRSSSDPDRKINPGD